MGWDREGVGYVTIEEVIHGEGPAHDALDPN